MATEERPDNVMVMCRALDLYEAPFSFHGGYIWDNKGNVVSDEGGYEASIARVRGWDRIGYFDDPEALQDAIGQHIAAALTEYWTKHKGT